MSVTAALAKIMEHAQRGQTHTLVNVDRGTLEKDIRKVSLCSFTIIEVKRMEHKLSLITLS